jgi:3-oxoacid CoA-transferase
MLRGSLTIRAGSRRLATLVPITRPIPHFPSAISASSSVYSRSISSSSPPSPLSSVPGPAENIGQPAINPSKGKVWPSADEAVKDIKSGSTLLSAGFGLCGTAETIIEAIGRNKGITGLTGVSNNAGDGVYGLGEWAWIAWIRSKVNKVMM